MFNTPILFLIFNRLDTTAEVFEQIRNVKPIRLFIAADGPRENIDGEREKCLNVRDWVLGQIDWDCAVTTLFRNENLGCKYAVSSAISWFFENVEEGIILEDDCLPNGSFFFFCEEMLHKYKNVETVKHICGNNFQNGIRRGNADYYFSIYNHIWGWATWKRAWLQYDVEMKEFDRRKFAVELCRIVCNASFIKYWLDIFTQANLKLIDTWDYQWTFCIWRNRGVSVTPNCNLVSNIGFGANATHTVDPESKLANYPISSMVFPLVHNDIIQVNWQADEFVSKEVYNIKSWKKGDFKCLYTRFLNMYKSWRCQLENQHRF